MTDHPSKKQRMLSPNGPPPAVPGFGTNPSGSPAARPSDHLHAGKNPQKPLAIAALGASAGGLEAFEEFFGAMPAATGLAFVVIQHLSPESPSMLAEILARHTTMPVLVAEEGRKVAADHLYVIPPNKYLSLREGKLHVEDVPLATHLRLPIDHFFHALALDQQQRAIGIILSGTGTDGTRGLQAIKENGGMVVVQDPSTARQDGMPTSALGTGMADCAVPIGGMPEILLKYARTMAGSPQASPANEATIDAITGLIRVHTKRDLSGYKKGTLVRRVQRRMGLRGLEAFADYLALLHDDPQELQLLAKDLLIGVTRFFRDAEAFKALTERVISPLIEAASPGTSLRIWVPGCSTGEEPYSIAIVLTEQIAQAKKDLNFKIFATDVDAEALEAARRGEYPTSLEVDVSTDRLQRFFLKQGDSYRILQELREKIVFAEQNLIGDPPFSRLDLISCRNLLIYLGPALQARAIELFNYVLNDGGYLFLGSSESLGEKQDLFLPISKKWRIFQRTGPRRGGPATYPIATTTEPLGLGLAPKPLARPPASLADRVQRQLLEQHTPAAVLVGGGSEVLFLHGPSGRYLDPPSGSAPFDLMAMCPAGLRHQVRVAVDRARRTRKCEVALGGKVEREAGTRSVRVTAEPFEMSDARDVLLIIFEDYHSAAAPGAGGPEGPERADVLQLEQELKTTKEDLNDTIRALETANSELMTANEEAASLNEEMQSTNEELETSKEELQSLNEELTSVNNQLNDKLQELEGTNNDLINLLASTDMATLFLDIGLRIRRFTPATRALLALRPEDQGRPIGDFARKFSDERLLEDAQQVLDHLRPIEKEIKSSEGRWYLRRIVPYRTTSHRIDGVVITFTEISRLKAIEAALREAHQQLEQRNVEVEEQVVERTSELGSANSDLRTRTAELANQKEILETIIDHAPVGIAYCDRELTLRWANPVLAALIGIPIERVIRHRASDVFVKANEPFAHQLRKVLEGGVPIEEQGFPLQSGVGDEARTVLLDMMYVPVRDAQGQIAGAVGVFLDASQRVERERMQQQQIEHLRELDHLKTDFLNTASHELRTPLSSVTGYAEFLEDQMGGPLTEEQRLFVAEIQKGGRRLKHLVDDMLDFARLEAGTFALACHETDLASLVETEVASLRPQAEEGHLELNVFVPETPEFVFVDATRIGQVLLNVVGNAIKFTPPGGQVDVTLTREPEELRVEVRDTGPGIAPEHQSQLFERFFQVDPSMTRTHGGTGLGLEISKAFVEAHGGAIGVRSELDHGSTFWFTLPLPTGAPLA